MVFHSSNCLFVSEIEEEMDSCSWGHFPFLMDKMTIALETLVMESDGPYGSSGC